ncbi:MAG: histidine phosphatase family protein [Patescibacteria group bacterium]|nr:histidine phosphatase family protein [Patescibacteria group bacterium]
MSKLFVFRHGQTVDNKEKIFSGFRQTDLTPEGIEEAKGIGEKLKNERVTRAYQSDQIRSQHTLELVLNGWHKGVEIITDARIKERGYGDLTGKSKVEIEQQNPQQYKLWHRSYDVPPPGGESIKDVEKRVLEFLNDVIRTWKKDDVIFISAHGNSLRPMRRYFEHISIEQMCSFEHAPGKIYSYEI